MNQLVKINYSPASLVYDFKSAKEALENEVAKYDVVVTAETLKDAKKMATELNKRSKEIDDLRKGTVKAVSEPIAAFDSDMKLLVNICKNGRQKIIEQTTRFEEETRIKIRAMLSEHLSYLWEKNQIRDEFKRSNIDGLDQLANITGTGKLAGKAMRELEVRVQQDFAVQQKVDMRLMQLENKCLKAGLVAPLTRAHVERFLLATDDEYENQLESLISIEIDRQKKTQDAVEPVTKSHEAEPQAAQDQPQTAAEPQKDEPASQGKVRWMVSAVFNIETPDHITDEQVVAKVRQKLTDAGFTTLTELRAIKR